MSLDFKCEISLHSERLSDYYDQLSHIVRMCIEKNSFDVLIFSISKYLSSKRLIVDWESNPGPSITCRVSYL